MVFLFAEASPFKWLAVALMVGTLFCSFTFWVQIFIRWCCGQSLRIGVSRLPVPWSGRVVYLSFFVTFFAPTFILLAAAAEPGTSPKTFTVLDVQRGCAAGITQAWVLLMMLHVHYPLRAMDLGWRRLAHRLQPPTTDGVENPAPLTVSTLTRTDLLIGFLGFIACWMPVFAVNQVVALSRALILKWNGMTDVEPKHPFFTILENDPQWSTIAWIALSVVVVAPLVEELLYRVVLQGYLETRNPHLAVMVSSLVFAGVHSLDGRPDALPLFPLALTLGFIYQQRHSYPAVVLLHALFNGLNLLLAVSMSK